MTADCSDLRNAWEAPSFERLWIYLWIYLWICSCPLHDHEPATANAVLEGHAFLPPAKACETSVGVFGGSGATHTGQPREVAAS